MIHVTWGRWVHSGNPFFIPKKKKKSNNHSILLLLFIFQNCREKTKILTTTSFMSDPPQILTSLCNRNSKHTHTKLKNKKMLLCKPSLLTLPQLRTSTSTPRNPKRSLSIITTNSTTPTQRRRTMSAFEARISLVFALASQASSLSQRRKCPIPIPIPFLLFSLLF